jgi:hypothetical protein
MNGCTIAFVLDARRKPSGDHIKVSYNVVAYVGFPIRVIRPAIASKERNVKHAPLIDKSLPLNPLS